MAGRNEKRMRAQPRYVGPHTHSKSFFFFSLFFFFFFSGALHHISRLTDAAREPRGPFVAAGDADTEVGCGQGGGAVLGRFPDLDFVGWGPTWRGLLRAGLSSQSDSSVGSAPRVDWDDGVSSSWFQGTCAKLVVFLLFVVSTVVGAYAVSIAPLLVWDSRELGLRVPRGVLLAGV